MNVSFATRGKLTKFFSFYQIPNPLPTLIPPPPPRFTLIPGGYSGFQVTGKIEWSQKSRPKKIPRASSKTQKNPWTKNWPKKIPRVCLFIIPSEYILSLIWFFLIPPKNPYSNQATQAKFSYPKKSRNRKFQTQKSPSIIPVTWNPKYPPLGPW